MKLCCVSLEDSRICAVLFYFISVLCCYFASLSIRLYRFNYFCRERRSSPKFIVTLHGGLDERANEVQKQQHQQHSRELDRLLIDLNPKGPMAVLESAQNEVNRMARQLDLLQSVSIPTSGSFLPILLSQGAVIAPPRSDVVSSITRPVFQETLPLMSMKNALPENKFFQQPNRIVSSIPTPLPAMQTAFEDRENAKIGNQNREVVVPLQTENDSEHDEVEGNYYLQTFALCVENEMCRIAFDILSLLSCLCLYETKPFCQ